MDINKIRFQKGLSRTECMEHCAAEEAEVFYYMDEQGVKNDEAIHASILEGVKLTKMLQEQFGVQPECQDGMESSICH